MIDVRGDMWHCLFVVLCSVWICLSIKYSASRYSTAKWTVSGCWLERNPHKMAIKFNNRLKSKSAFGSPSTMCQSIRVVNYEFDQFKCFDRDGSSKNYDVWLSSTLLCCYQISHFESPIYGNIYWIAVQTTNRSHTCFFVSNGQKLRLFILEERPTRIHIRLKCWTNY